MDPTSPEVVGTEVTPADGTQATPDKSNVQARIDELTAEKNAERKRAEEAAAQVAQLTAVVAAQMANQHAAATPVKQEPAFEVPEGMDPATAKFFATHIERAQKAAEEKAQAMFWQIQHQMDQQNVAQQYSGLPPEVVQDAAKRLTGLKQQYGQGVTMEDAVAVAHFQWMKKQGKVAASNAFNQMPGPMAGHGAQPPVQQPSTNLASPASHPDWDKWDNATQNAAITAWEKKGGSLF